MSKQNRLSKWLVSGAVIAGLSVTGFGTGCLSRPVGKQDPTTKVNFTTSVKKASVDKIDLLLMIDNSSSMGDKQAILADAVPDLVNRLVTPNCVDDAGKPNGETADPNKAATEQCSKGKPEFPPVTDIHVGIVSSSLGGFGGNQCTSDAPAKPGDPPRNSNDQAHLVNRTKVVSEPSNFLAWFPDTETNRSKVLPYGYTYEDQKKYTDKSSPSFSDAFAEVVTGVAQNGCGLEAQLESFYRFLIQPDPYKTIKLDGDTSKCQGNDGQGGSFCPASLEGYDDTILKERADFLRPDSLVAVILLTDEDDSSVDPLSFHGAGWVFMNSYFPGSSIPRTVGGLNTANGGTTAALATKACDNSPGDPECKSCAFKDDPGSTTIADDPNCKKNPHYYGGDDDSLNVRFFHMKQRFGADPQFPIQRYVDGLTKTRIPDRSSEHDSSGNYKGTASCVNPLYAQTLPTDSSGAESGALCNLAIGPRSSDLVFFAVVGGVPHQLITENTDENGAFSEAGWKKVLGEDPANYNYSGIDPHMIQSITPRDGLPAAAAVGENGSDPYHGREWDTKKVDLQYACTFELDPGKAKICPDGDLSCDCDGTKAPPLCDSANPKKQIRAKAYPTIREFQVVRALGSQGIIASLCPEFPLQSDKSGPNAEKYGYRPAVKSIVDRLKDALANTCIPQALTRDSKSGEVPCLLLETLADEGDTCEAHGLKDPDPVVLKSFREQQKLQQGDVSGKDGGAPVVDLTKLPVCEIPQIVKGDGESCDGDSTAGWCYVTNFGKCKQSVLLTQTAQVPGSQTYLQCINQFTASSSDNASSSSSGTDNTGN